jgi:hypothetical protein
MPRNDKGCAQRKLDALGIDAVCSRIINGETMTAIAKSAGADMATLTVWLAADENRSARAREARIQAARAWDERATEAIERAADPFELSKAKELAHHYRWRASKIAPRDYGDRVQHSGDEDGGPLQVVVRSFAIAQAPGAIETVNHLHSVVSKIAGSDTPSGDKR